MLLRHLLVAAALAATAAAQTITLPTGLDVAEGNSNNAFPWNRATSTALRTQLIYDSSHFTNQGITTPIIITRLRWRANAVATSTSWAGGTLNNCTVELSTAAVDQASPSTNFDLNHGPDRAVVHTGQVQFQGGSGFGTTLPGPTVIDIPTAPFIYVPAAGDLLIDCQIPSNSPLAGFVGTQLDVTTTPAPLASRVHDSTTAGVGTIVLNTGHVVTIDYTLATSLAPSFRASTRTGITPGLTVNFTDLSWSPAGVTSWAWDLDGIPGIDSTVQNPTWVYNSCGSYNVSLTVTDNAHPAGLTLTQNNLIVTDEINANFTVAQTSAPNLYTLTDTTSPPATAWAWEWDANSPGPESTLQNPTVLWDCGLRNVTLTATRHCRTSTKTRAFATSPTSFTTTYAAGNTGSSGWLVFLDANVTNPLGVNLCGLSINTGTAGGTPFTVRMLVTPGSYIGNDNNLAAWREVGTAAGITAGSVGTPSGATFPQHVYLPPGSYGIALQPVGASFAVTNGNGGNQAYSNADVALSLGATRTTFFAGGLLNTPRVWNGTLHYEAYSPTSAVPAYGFFGAGCPTTTSVIPGQSILAMPSIGGTMSVNFTNLPQSTAIQMLGFSRTTSSYGPLPLDLAIVGAPGCFGRVSPDATSFLFGAGGTATWNLAIPINPSLLWTQFYTQALVLDTPLNALGAAISDAYAGIVGN